jgi:hypothetical protein
VTPPATAQQLADLTQQQQADEAARLEDATATEADAGTDAALAAALTAALAAWVATFGSLAAAGAGVELATYLAQVRADTDRATGGLGRRAGRVIERALPDAAQLGARHATDFAHRASGRRPDVPGVDVSRDALDAARALASTVREQLRLAGRLLSPRMVSVTGWRGVVTALGAARRAVSIVRSAVAWSVHRAVNGGAAQATAALGARGLWVSEPDACVRCLAYSGQLTDRDGRFPGGLSMDPASRTTRRAALEGPPLHPNCRCRLVPWLDEWAHGRTALPDLLRAQALRSVAMGRGRPSESNAARIRAARYLLARRGSIPDRLRRHAQSAVAAGHF